MIVVIAFDTSKVITTKPEPNPSYIGNELNDRRQTRWNIQLQLLDEGQRRSEPNGIGVAGQEDTRIGFAVG